VNCLDADKQNHMVIVYFISDALLHSLFYPFFLALQRMQDVDSQEMQWSQEAWGKP